MDLKMPPALLTPSVSRGSVTDVLAQIGNTPLIRLQRLTADLPGVEIYGKAEYQNPGGSEKDRPALNMILTGEREGLLTHDKIILDATSGNTGIAYAMIGAVKGYRIRLCVPKNASMERKRMLAAYGAEVIYTDPADGSDGAIRKCKEIYGQNPDIYFHPDQYGNDNNWRAHFNTTAVEIMEQTGGRVTHFIAALGTSGTCMGVSRRFHRDLPHVKCFSAQPSSGFHGLEGLKHMPTAIVPPIYDEAVPDGNIWLETEDAHKMVRRVAREEGLLVGISAGGNLWGARKLAEECAARGEEAVIVAILCDGAAKYLSEHFWDDHD